jgi:GT2 family glycosyltransferase
MTARAEDGASEETLARARATQSVRLGDILKRLTRPGVIGRTGRALGYLWQYGPKASRATLLLRMGASPPYREWIATYDTLRPANREALSRRAAQLADPPLISLLTTGAKPDERDLAGLLAAARAQLYPNWELVIGAPSAAAAQALEAQLLRPGPERRLRFAPAAPGEEPGAAALAEAKGRLAIFCAPGYEPREHALLLAAERFAARPDADVVYWDEDELVADGERRDPWFKPDWNPDLNLAQGLFGGAVACRLDAVRKAGALRPGFGQAAVFDLGLRLTEAGGPGRVEHIPHVLFHRRGVADAAEADVAARARAVADHLQRRGLTACATPNASTGAVRVSYDLASAPLVSIIIPTTDRIDLLEPCLAGLISGTDYANLEILIVDCASREPATAQWLAAAVARDARVRVIRREGLFNYSAANNLAARQAAGEILLLLNNDTKVIRPDWLTEMAANLQRPEVGAVGAKLLYLDGGVQHGGVCFQEGETLHLGLGLKRDDRGYHGQMAMPREISAVTGACLALRRATFERVGGLNEALRVAFNDVDLCLRIRQLGLAIVWTPYAELYHHESATGGLDRSLRRRLEGRREQWITQHLWAEAMRRDPFHSPNLAVWDGREHPSAPPPFGPGCGLAFPPRTPRPW